MNILEKLMHSLAAPMTPLPAYGSVHIIILIAGFSVFITGAWLLRRADERQNKIILLTYAGILIASEIFKQVFLYYVLCDGAICWSEFPFQMCSLPMYLCPLVAFTKNERLRSAAYSFMMCFNMMGGLGGAFEPSGLFHEYVALTVHAVFWHFSLIFLSCYIAFSRRGGVGKQCYFDMIKLFVLCCFIAFVINSLAGVYLDKTVNMFFVGPNNPPVVILGKVAEKFGWVASTVIYIPAASLGAAIIYRLCAIGRKDKGN